MTSRDWQNFRPYVRRVRNLTNDYDFRLPMTYGRELLETLMSPSDLEVGPLFPSLRHLTWQFRDPQDFLFVGSLTSCPKLCEVELRFSEDSEEHDDSGIFRSLVHVAGTLESIKATSGSDSEVDLYLPLSGTLSSFQSLKKLEIWHDGERHDVSFAPKVLALAAQLPMLEELNVMLPPAGDRSAHNLGFDGYFSFPTLQNLIVDDPYVNARSLLQLLCHQRLPFLKTLDMTIHNMDDSDLSNLTATIAKSCSPTSLASIELSVWYRGEGVESPTPSDGVIQPLLNFRNITIFRFRDFCHQVMDGVELELLATAWPCLRVFSVIDLAQHILLPPGHQSKITMKGLRNLLEKCPFLEELAIALDATVDLEDRVSSPLNKTITEIEVWSSPIYAPHLVAPVLYSMLPRLRAIKCYPRGLDGGFSDPELDPPTIMASWVETALLVQEYSYGGKSEQPGSSN